MSEPSQNERPAIHSDKLSRKARKQRFRTLRERRREKRSLKERAVVQQLSSMTDEQLDEIAEKPLEDGYHHIAKKIRRQRRVARKKDLLARLGRLSVSELMTLGDSDFAGVNHGEIQPKLRSQDSKSLNDIRMNAQAASIREAAAQVLVKRSDAERQNRLRQIRQKFAAMPIDELEQLAVGKDDDSKLAATVFRERLYEDLRSLSTPRLRELRAKGGNTIRSTVAAKVLLGRNEAPAPPRMESEESIPDDANRPRWI